MSDPDDLVVLVDQDGVPVGSAPRIAVHTDATPLHRAFSLYLRGGDGRLLLTRRALTKVTWPGVWTNSCCGHPRPAEQTADAVRRRTRQELGVEVADLRCVLPQYRYRAVDASGVVENELCPVFVADLVGTQIAPDPAEVAEHAWVDWSALVTAVAATPMVFSPWAADQVTRLASVDAFEGTRSGGG